MNYRYMYFETTTPRTFIASLFIFSSKPNIAIIVQRTIRLVLSLRNFNSRVFYDVKCKSLIRSFCNCRCFDVL